MSISLERVRNSSKAKLLDTLNKQQGKIRQLSERRKVNQRKIHRGLHRRVMGCPVKAHAQWRNSE